ncbi:hypothetical protein GQ55_1G445700 [Panicum hallii var. hallii]|uniref:Uncharacterized protein n=1 Tax=Panicum hallii var. hallii TaxID=1504633 RepID=A0A2T7FE60_9POAL|nr:hypothetical protein GQ55_1G445700 [Panicum hallii var. hallii]
MQGNNRGVGDSHSHVPKHILLTKVGAPTLWCNSARTSYLSSAEYSYQQRYYSI